MELQLINMVSPAVEMQPHLAAHSPLAYYWDVPLGIIEQGFTTTGLLTSKSKFKKNCDRLSESNYNKTLQNLFFFFMRVRFLQINQSG